MSDELTEVEHTLQRLRNEFEDLAVGGLRAIGPDRLPVLTHMRDSLIGIGAQHMANRLSTLIAHLENDQAEASESLMRAQACLQSFERILTLETSAAALNNWQASLEEQPEP